MAHRWLAAGVILLTSICGASAQSWPSKTVRIIIPVSAGSATDVTARIVAEHLAQQLGQPFVVENRTGAGGTTGMGYVAKQVDTAAKAKPGSINYSTVGYGAAAHLAAERLRLAAGFEAQQIPFRGAPEAINEVLAGRADFFFSPALAAVPLIRAGKLVGLATSSSKRARSLPDVPTTIEAGYPNSAYNFWLGMWVPVKTPRDVVEKLYQETRKALDLKEVQDKLIALGNEPERMTPAQFDTFFHNDIALNAQLVKAAGIKPNP
jgi:tripartite-type tricarboxylate transporter receptor subunit TctC